MTQIVLLGPQRRQPTLGATLDSLGLSGPVAAISAGWQEREAELEDLADASGFEVKNLELHRRVEDIFRQDPVFREAHRAHQRRLKRLQEIYRARLNYAQGGVWHLLKQKQNYEEALLDGEIENAIEAIRALDRHHLGRIETLNQAFEKEWSREVQSEIQNHRNELAETIEGCSALLIAGGHVAVLLNRMRLLRLTPFLHDRPLIAWSAGAMILSKRIVLFHDTPPQGRGYAEVFENGLAVLPKFVPLPHARKRLLLEDSERIAVFTRRFDEATCITLDEGARLDWNGKRWKAGTKARRLCLDGSLEEVEGPWG